MNFSVIFLAIIAVTMLVMMYLMWTKLNEEKPDRVEKGTPPQLNPRTPVPPVDKAEEKEKVYRSRQIKGFLVDGLLILVGAGLYFTVDWLIYFTNSGSMGLDPVFLQKIAYTILALFVGASMSFLLFKLRFPQMYKYLLRDGFDDFFEIPIRDRVWLVIIIILVFLLCFTIILT